MKRLVVAPISEPIQGRISPRWVKWFNDITAIINGDSLAAPAAVTVGASPFTFQYTGTNSASLIVNGGTVSNIAFSRNGTTYFTLGTTSGMFTVSPGDYIQVTYSAAPTITTIPR